MPGWGGVVVPPHRDRPTCPKRILLPLVINVVKAIPENWFLTKATFLWACTVCAALLSRAKTTAFC